MAVTGISHKEAVERQHKMEAWSGVISWVLYGLLAVLVIAVVLVIVDSRRKENRQAELRGVWDQYYLAFKDKDSGPQRLSSAERIPVLEGLWDKMKGTPVQPYVAMELAQAHYQEAVNALKDPNTGQRTLVEDSIKSQRASFEKALQVFDVVRKDWSENPAYGPLAFEGAALCKEQMKEFGEAIGILEEGIKKHPKHFLVEKMRYDLARNYWLRALSLEHAGKDGSEDREKALDSVTRSVSEVNDKDVSPMSWRFEARFLKSLLQKPGDIMKIFPNGKPPMKPEPRKDAGDAKKPDTEKKPDAEKKPDTEKKADTEKKPTVEKKPDANK